MDPGTLDEAPLFASLPQETKQELAEHVNDVTVDSGKHLVDQGDQSYNLFVILKGNAEVYRDGHSVAELGPGDFFGEMGTVGETGRSATVVSKNQMRVLTLSTHDVQRLKESAPDVLDELERTIAQRQE